VIFKPLTLPAEWDWMQARIPDGFETSVDYVVVRINKYNCRWYVPAEMPVTAPA